jgi:hypothetical protein
VIPGFSETYKSIVPAKSSFGLSRKTVIDVMVQLVVATILISQWMQPNLSMKLLIQFVMSHHVVQKTILQRL